MRMHRSTYRVTVTYIQSNAYTHTYTYIYIHIHTCAHAYTQACIHAYMHMHAHFGLRCLRLQEVEFPRTEMLLAQEEFKTQNCVRVCSFGAQKEPLRVSVPLAQF